MRTDYLNHPVTGLLQRPEHPPLRLEDLSPETLSQIREAVGFHRPARAARKPAPTAAQAVAQQAADARLVFAVLAAKLRPSKKPAATVTDADIRRALARLPRA